MKNTIKPTATVQTWKNPKIYHFVHSPPKRDQKDFIQSSSLTSTLSGMPYTCLHTRYTTSGLTRVEKALTRYVKISPTWLILSLFITFTMSHSMMWMASHLPLKMVPMMVHQDTASSPIWRQAKVQECMTGRRWELIKMEK